MCNGAGRHNARAVFHVPPGESSVPHEYIGVTGSDMQRQIQRGDQSTRGKHHATSWRALHFVRRASLRPIVMQSDPRVEKRRTPTGILLELNFSGPPSCRPSDRIHSVVLSLGAVGVRDLCCMAVASGLETALCCAFSSNNACDSRAASPRPRGFVALDLAESR